MLLFLVFAISIPRISASTQSHSILFNVYFISGDSVSRDAYVALDGSAVAHTVIGASGSLPTTVSWDDSVTHYVTAWPIINHDRSLYGGSLSIDGQTCAQSSDVWQNNPLTCSTSPAPQQTTVYLNAYVVDSSSGSPISGASLFLDGTYVESSNTDGKLALTFTHPPETHSYRITANGYQDASGTWTVDSSKQVWSFTVQMTPNAPQANPPSLTLYTPQVNCRSVTINGVTSPQTAGATIARLHWDWGDGTGDDQWFPASHTYTGDGTFVVGVTSYDSSGLSVGRTATVTIACAPQTTSFDFQLSIDPGSQSIDAGASATFAVTVTLKAGDPQIVQLSVTGGGGSTSSYIKEPSGTPTFETSLIVLTSQDTKPGPYYYSVYCSGGSVTSVVQVTVNVQSPTQPRSQPPNVVLNDPVVSGLTVRIDGVTSAYGASITGINWKWGDGTPAEDHPFPNSHTYAKSGSFTVSVTVYDTNGLSSTSSVEVNVQPTVSPPTAPSSFTMTLPRAPGYDPDPNAVLGGGIPNGAGLSGKVVLNKDGRFYAIHVDVNFEGTFGNGMIDWRSWKCYYQVELYKKGGLLWVLDQRVYSIKIQVPQTATRTYINGADVTLPNISQDLQYTIADGGHYYLQVSAACTSVGAWIFIPNHLNFWTNWSRTEIFEIQLP